jgi:hypothetical protein
MCKPCSGQVPYSRDKVHFEVCRSNATVESRNSVGLVRVKAILASSRPIDAYGGMEFPEQIIRDLATAVARGNIPMSIGHDASRPLTTHNVSSGVDRSEDGYLQARVEFDVDEVAWAEFQGELREAGVSGFGGMSVTFMTPLENESWRDGVAIAVSGDAHHFTDDEIAAAAAVFREVEDSVVARRMYQLSAEPLLRVVFDLSMNLLGTLGPNILASVIYDAAKGMFKRGKHNKVDITFRESPEGARELTVAINVESEEELKVAMDRLPAVLESGARGTFAHMQAGYARVDTEKHPELEPAEPVHADIETQHLEPLARDDS